MHDTESDERDASAGSAVVCPRCGHELSMYEEPAMTRGEAVASKLARAFGTWHFLLVLLVLVLGALGASVLWSVQVPAMGNLLTYLWFALGMLVTIQTPLILITQHRNESRDRARDQEAFLVALHTEADIHVIRDLLERRTEIEDGNHRVPNTGLPRDDGD
ncbi:DUF1003 domain-containing protein [Promicromonospora iranensis]|uniref:DUF1003 domain-containing protein n=1 Tax=Promicromonospora iranensis TaxID=1105144 RepID=UPI0023A9176A|nr:DUF1003 domain-containing protein [Promicromonospora iranensis]